MANAWNLGDLMSRATLRVGYRDDISLSDASFWVNEAYTAYVTDVNEFLSEATTGFSVSSGDSRLTLPADFMDMISLSETTSAAARNRAIPRISPEYADELGYFPAAEPKGYFIYKDIIQLHPSASSSANTTHASSGRSLLMRYKAMPDSMLSNVSVPSVATEYRIGILYKAEQFLHEHVGNLEEAAFAETRYLNFVTQVKDKLYKRQGDRRLMKIRLADRSSRRLEGRLEDQDTEWLK